MKWNNKTKRYTVMVGIFLFALAYFAWKMPFYEFKEDVYQTDLNNIFSIGYLEALFPFMIIIVLSVIGIRMCIYVQGKIQKKNPLKKSFTTAYMGKLNGKVKGQKKFGFMAIRWIIMISSFFIMVFGGIITGLRFAKISIPVFFCPVNTQQLTESSCYYLAHLKELAELPVKDIMLFLISTIGFTILFGRILCGFLCPMGLIQDIMHAIRQKTKTEGIAMTERMYQKLVPVKWIMVFLMLGLAFLGGNFCNFCPAVTLSPAFAGMKISLYLSGFVMVFVLIASFFKRRAWCSICPLGYMLGLVHKISPFRVKKNCQACTECGACYEACPMGIKMIYTEREKSDVTDINCIMCGECIKKCPENDALSMTFAGHSFYTASREQVLSGYEDTANRIDEGKRRRRGKKVKR